MTIPARLYQVASHWYLLGPANKLLPLTQPRRHAYTAYSIAHLALPLKQLQLLPAPQAAQRQRFDGHLSAAALLLALQTDNQGRRVVSQPEDCCGEGLLPAASEAGLITFQSMALCLPSDVAETSLHEVGRQALFFRQQHVTVSRRLSNRL